MQNKLLSLIPEYLPLGLVIYDKDGYLKYANNIAFAMFGTTMEEVLDINIFDEPMTGLKTEAEVQPEQLHRSQQPEYNTLQTG